MSEHKPISEHRLVQIKLWMLAIVFYAIGAASLIIGGPPA